MTSKRDGFLVAVKMASVGVFVYVPVHWPDRQLNSHIGVEDIEHQDRVRQNNTPAAALYDKSADHNMWQWGEIIRHIFICRFHFHFYILSVIDSAIQYLPLLPLCNKTADAAHFEEIMVRTTGHFSGLRSRVHRWNNGPAVQSFGHYPTSDIRVIPSSRRKMRMCALWSSRGESTMSKVVFWIPNSQYGHKSA